MKISALQFAPRLLDKEYNLKKMKQLLSVLKTDLVVLPELCNSGYVFANKEEVFSMFSLIKKRSSPLQKKQEKVRHTLP